MMLIGLSPALGAFLAGVVLADSEYRHELESDLEPFNGLLLGIFFISIGASLNFTYIGKEIVLILSLTLSLIVLKFLILAGTAFVFKLPAKNRWLFSLALAQGGEFAFVLFKFSKTNGVLPEATIDPLISAVAISMFLAPLLFVLWEKLGLGKSRKDAAERESDTIEAQGKKVILAGFGRLGTDLGRFLISSGVKPVIIDNDAVNVEILREFGFEVCYGDITRLDLLESAGAHEAELIIITIGNLEKACKLVETINKHYPHLKVVACAADRSSTCRLMDLGVTHIRRETFGSAMDLGQVALELLDTSPYKAYRLKGKFKNSDESSLPELYKLHREDEEKYISMYQQQTADLEELMTFDKNTNKGIDDKARTAVSPDN